MISMRSTLNRSDVIGFATSAILFVASCFLPAIHVPDWGVLYGGGCLIFMMLPAWWANPILLLGFIGAACKCSTELIGIGVLAFAVAASFLFYHDSTMTLQIGYWVWLSSFAMFTLASVARHMLRAEDTTDIWNDLNIPRGHRHDRTD